MISPDLPIRSDATRATCNCFGFVLCVFPIFFLLVSYATPVQDLIGDLPSQCMIEVSELLDQEDEKGGGWRQLWSELLHKSPNESVIHQQRDGPTLFLLKTWCQIKPPGAATVGELVNTLNAVNHQDIAVIIEKHCQVSVHLAG